MRDLAVFAIFRRTAETPLYRIEKRPKLRARQGLYAVVGMDGRVLRRGQDLDQVLKVLESSTTTANEVTQLDFTSYEKFEAAETPPGISQRLQALDVETLTPLEALNTLYELKQQL